MPKREIVIEFPFRVEGWSDLSTLIEYFSYYNGVPWLFRGVTKLSYRLIPSGGRDTRRHRDDGKRVGGSFRIPYRLRDEKAVLDMFIQQARAHTSTDCSALEWMAVAQHFGVPTRLLDWTDSLLPAIWFAIANSGPDEDSRVWVTADVPRLDPLNKVDPFSLTEPHIYRPPHITPRIAAQGSVLMICPKPDSEVTLEYEGEIIIAGRAKFELRKRLNACGVNKRSLFPDLAGLGEHLAWLYKNNWLAGYKDSKPPPME
jgi:hypothetical protein